MGSDTAQGEILYLYTCHSYTLPENKHHQIDSTRKGCHQPSSTQSRQLIADYMLPIHPLYSMDVLVSIENASLFSGFF